MYFTQVPTFYNACMVEFCDTCSFLHDVCFVLEIQKKLKKYIEIELISRQKNIKKGRKRVKESAFHLLPLSYSIAMLTIFQHLVFKVSMPIPFITPSNTFVWSFCSNQKPFLAHPKHKSQSFGTNQKTHSIQTILSSVCEKDIFNASFTLGFSCYLIDLEIIAHLFGT